MSLRNRKFIPSKDKFRRRSSIEKIMPTEPDDKVKIFTWGSKIFQVDIRNNQIHFQSINFAIRYFDHQGAF